MDSETVRLDYEKSLADRIGLDADAFREWIVSDATLVIECDGIKVTGIAVTEGESEEGIPCWIVDANVQRPPPPSAEDVENVNQCWQYMLDNGPVIGGVSARDRIAVAGRPELSYSQKLECVLKASLRIPIPEQFRKGVLASAE